MGKSFKLGIALFVASLLIIGLFWLRSCIQEDHVDVGSDNKIDITPTQIQSIRAIGEWEFLSISAEELVDTVRKGIFSDDELARIYYGTLRLGINTHQLEPGWVETVGDSIVLTLPAVGLLDQDFIDEARTKPFFESGTWKPKDREAMYRQAHNSMLHHGLTKENLDTAEANAHEQISNLLRAMGYKHVRIVFRKAE